MNKTFQRLASVASELDARGLKKEASMIDGVLERLAQVPTMQTPNPLNSMGQLWNAATQGVQGIAGLMGATPQAQSAAGLWNATAAGLNWFPAELQKRDAEINALKQQITNIERSGRDSTPIKQQLKQKEQQKQQLISTYQSEENKLIQRYLGWGFDAAKRKGLAAARTALQQHLSRQSPQFAQKVMAEFEAKVASQQAFQAQTQRTQV